MLQNRLPTLARSPPRPAPVHWDRRSRERGWLDLFYDLVFVAAILILSSAFSHADESARASGSSRAFVAVWWVWLATTLHANRFPDDDVGYRLVALAQMFLVALVAIGASDGARRERRVRLDLLRAC